MHCGSAAGSHARSSFSLTGIVIVTHEVPRLRAFGPSLGMTGAACFCSSDRAACAAAFLGVACFFAGDCCCGVR